MGTVVFDFDSTLIKHESLERLLLGKLALQPDLQQKVRAITEEGLRGQIPFQISLSKRLLLAAPSKEDVLHAGTNALDAVTSGMKELINALQTGGVDVWLVSGGIRESLLPVGKFLGIPTAHILGVSLLWNEGGAFKGIDPNDPLSRSKVEGLREKALTWQRPRIAVGDAMSDYKLFEEGVVDHFILYTEHYQCPELLKTGIDKAANTAQLKNILEKELICSL